VNCVGGSGRGRRASVLVAWSNFFAIDVPGRSALVDVRREGGAVGVGAIGGIGGRGGMRVAAGAGVRRVGGRSVVGVGVEGRGAVVGDIGIPIGTATRLELLPAIRTVPLGALGRQMLSTNT
jgi:hypothetical protein